VRAEYLPRQIGFGMKVVIELLAGVPSVVYGLLGILLLRDWIYELLTPFDPLSGDTLLTAGVLLAIMVLPTIATLSDDALCAVPSAQRRAARALGLTRAETIFSVVLPQAARGLGSAVLLGFGRGIGETVAVFLVIGRQDNQLPEYWLSGRAFAEAGQTITTKLGSSETNIAYGDPLHWAAITGLALLLLCITGGVTALATELGKEGGCVSCRTFSSRLLQRSAASFPLDFLPVCLCCSSSGVALRFSGRSSSRGCGPQEQRVAFSGIS
jgi:phosphate transport system permease protein